MFDMGPRGSPEHNGQRQVCPAKPFSTTGMVERSGSSGTLAPGSPMLAETACPCYAMSVNGHPSGRSAGSAATGSPRPSPRRGPVIANRSLACESWADPLCRPAFTRQPPLSPSGAQRAFQLGVDVLPGSFVPKAESWDRASVTVKVDLRSVAVERLLADLKTLRGKGNEYISHRFLLEQFNRVRRIVLAPGHSAPRKDNRSRGECQTRQPVEPRRASRAFAVPTSSHILLPRAPLSRSAEDRATPRLGTLRPW